jgi:hypothetical protein
MLAAQELRKLRDDGVALSQEALEKIAVDEQFAEQQADDKLARVAAARKTHTKAMTAFDGATETLIEAMGIITAATDEYHEAYEAAAAASRTLSREGEAPVRPILLSARQANADYQLRRDINLYQAAIRRPI